MDAAGFIAAIGTESEALAAAAALAPAVMLPSCPDWTMRELLVHVGSVQRWAAATVTAGERVSRRDIPVPPDDTGLDGVLGWFGEGSAQLCDVLTKADPDAPAATFAGTDRRVRWWMRRQACETAMHRWDAQHAAAAGSAGSIEQGLAIEGIVEYLYDFLPGAVERAGSVAIPGTLHLHATDDGLDGGEWLIDFSATPIAVSAGHTKADTAVRGPVSDLLLWLWNRLATGGARLEVFGSPAPVLAWPELRL